MSVSGISELHLVSATVGRSGNIPEKLAGLDTEPLCPLAECESSMIRVVPVVLRAVLVHAENAKTVWVPINEKEEACSGPLVRHQTQELQRREVGVAFALWSAWNRAKLATVSRSVPLI